MVMRITKDCSAKKSRREREKTMAIFTVFFQMLALLIMIGTGYFFTKTGMLDAHTNKQMSRMLVNVFNPLLLISNAANAIGMITLDTLGTVSLIAVGMFLFFIIAGMILSPLFDKDKDQQRIFQMMFVFSNLGFIGIPVVSSVLGPEYVIYVTEFMMIYNVVFYTYGIALMNGGFSVSALKGMLNPGTISGPVALLMIIYEIQLPDFLKTSVTYLGNVTSPLALVAVGFALANSDLKQIFGHPRLYIFSIVKLLVLPLLMLPILRLVPAVTSLIPLCMIMFGMPIGNMPLILGTQKGIDCTTCSAAIILTTVLCVFTVPVLIAVAG